MSEEKISKALDQKARENFIDRPHRPRTLMSFIDLVTLHVRYKD